MFKVTRRVSSLKDEGTHDNIKNEQFCKSYFLLWPKNNISKWIAGEPISTPKTDVCVKVPELEVLRRY